MAAALIRSIRATTDHDSELDKYDLSHFTTEASVKELCTVFAAPLPATTPLRFTFIVGGGKLVRAKYEESLGRWLSNALRELGFEEDRGAALGSQAAFKRQEDTGQNLVFIHVFPRIVAAPAIAVAAAAAAADAPLVITPTQRVLNSTLAEFQRMIASRAPTWSEKRVVHAAELGAAITRMDTYETNLATRVPLSAAEQAEYDGLTRELLVEKSAWLHGEIKAHVAAGRLTGAEVLVVVKEMETKLAGMRAEAEKMTPGSEKAAAAAAAIAALDGKRAALAKALPAALAPLRAEAEIRKIRGRLAALERLEKARAGTAFTIAELREVGERPDLEAKLAALLAEAKGWWEADDAFAARVAASTRGGGGAGGGGAKGGKR